MSYENNYISSIYDKDRLIKDPIIYNKQKKKMIANKLKIVSKKSNNLEKYCFINNYNNGTKYDKDRLNSNNPFKIDVNYYTLLLKPLIKNDKIITLNNKISINNNNLKKNNIIFDSNRPKIVMKLYNKQSNYTTQAVSYQNNLISSKITKLNNLKIKINNEYEDKDELKYATNMINKEINKLKKSRSNLKMNSLSPKDMDNKLTARYDNRNLHINLQNYSSYKTLSNNFNNNKKSKRYLNTKVNNDVVKKSRELYNKSIYHENAKIIFFEKEKKNMEKIELKQCTFKPMLNNNTHITEDFFKRQKDYNNYLSIKKNIIKNEVDHIELRECSFVPKTHKTNAFEEPFLERQNKWLQYKEHKLSNNNKQLTNNNKKNKKELKSINNYLIDKELKEINNLLIN